MKKNYFFIALCGLVAALFAPAQAFAAAATFFNHTIALTGVPEGAGIVYLETNWNGKELDDIDEMAYEEDEIIVKATIETKDYKGLVHLYAIPNDGYEFVGFFNDTDMDGEFDPAVDEPVTFANSSDKAADLEAKYGHACNDYHNSPAIQVFIPIPTREYKDGDSTEANQAAAEAAAEADWAEFGLDNRFFAVFCEEGTNNIKAQTLHSAKDLYNTLGQKVGDDFRGIVITEGKKRLN